MQAGPLFFPPAQFRMFWHIIEATAPLVHRSTRTAVNIKPWTWSLLASVVVHAAVFAGAMFFVSHADSPGPARLGARPTPQAASPSSPQDRPAQAAPTSDQIRAILARHKSNAAAMTPQQRMSAFEQKLPELGAVRPESARAITSVIERLEGVDRERAFRPDPAATGPFDPASATLYDILRKEREGKVYYEWILVDSEGRSTTAEVPADQMSAGDLQTYRIMELSRGNPTLRRLVESAIRIGERKAPEEQ